MTKYRAQPVVVDGHRFASKAEAKRYGELMLLLRAKQIRNLEMQPEFPVVVNGVKICTYRADFAYQDSEGEKVEDVKGVRLPIFKIKKRLVEALYDVRIIEVPA